MIVDLERFGTATAEATLKITQFIDHDDIF